VQRAAIVLREKKIAFEFRHVEPDNRPDWFRDKTRLAATTPAPAACGAPAR
jgi:glutathione S-transferase